MLWVDQPMGTSFSQGLIVASSQEESAKEFVGWLSVFLETFGLGGVDGYLTGESYAGRYVPYIGEAILKEGIGNLKGALLYNACIGRYDYVQEQIPTAPFIRGNNEHFRFSPQLLDNLTKIHEDCGYQSYIDTYLTFPAQQVQPPANVYPIRCDIWSRVLNELRRQPGRCFNPYQIDEQCLTYPDVLGRPTNFSSTPYFNRTDVKKALNVPEHMIRTQCSNQDVYVGPKSGDHRDGRDMSLDPIQNVLPKLIEATGNVIMSNGNLDYVIITNGTLLSIQNMTWDGQLGFLKKPERQILTKNGTAGGLQHYERGFLWTETFKTGHMGPGSDPYIAYRQIQWLLGYTQHI